MTSKRDESDGETPGRQVAGRAVADDREVLCTLIDTLPELVFVKDTAGRVMLCNAPAARYLGMDKGDMLGKTAFDVNPPELARGYDADDRGVLATGAVCRREELIRSHTGEERWHLTTKTPLCDPQGRIAGVMVVCQDIHDTRAAAAALRENERRVRATLEAILAPDGAWNDLELRDIIDVPAIQALMEQFYRLTSVPMSILDREGRVLIGVGWQEICMRFHRRHPEASAHCRASDAELSSGIPPGESRLHKCRNNMWDIATPIMIGDRHVGSIFSGQFFFADESVDHETFRAQARRYGFDERDYLAALDAVPRIERGRIETAMQFFTKLADILSQLSYNNARLARTLNHRDALLIEREESAAALHEKEERLRLAQEFGGVGGWEFDPETQALDYAPQTCRIFGLPVGAIKTRDDWRERVHPDDLARVDAERDAAVAAHESFDMEYRILHPEHGIRWINTKGRAVYDETGRFVRLLGVNLDITARKEIERELFAIQQRLKGVMEAVPVGISFSDDATCQHITGNAAALAQFEVTAQDNLSASAPDAAAPGRQVQYFLAGKPIGDQDLPLQRACAENQTISPLELEVLLPSGRRWFAEVSGAPIRDAQGRVVGGVAVMIDITERKRAAEALAHAKAAAEAANMAKSQFLANMSHELRTPMSAILGMTNLALEEDVSVTVRDLLQTARESADSLLELLNEILDLSRIEAGGMQLESQPFGLRALLDKTLKTFGARAHEKHLELTREIAADVPDCFIGDALRLRQIFTNLVANALKFTNKGQIVVRVAAVEKRHDHICLQVAVADTGIGISAENRERIFAPFTQADASTTRRYGGTGLGLTICRRLVELMDGRIWVESQLGFGSTFSFTAWLQTATATDAAGAPPATHAQLADAHVLVIDDQEPSRRALHDMLAGWSMRPEVAADVPLALTKMHEAAAAGDTFRLVIANAFMPGIDGFALARWVQDEPRLAGRVALVMPPLTPAAAKRCEELRALCLEKPVSQAELLEVVLRAVVGGAVERDAPPATESAVEATARSLHILLAEDTPANRKLVTRILEKRGHRVAAVGNGQEAVARVCEADFDLVLMDVQMPGLDGFEATAMIRKLPDERKARVPIVAMTAHALKGDRERCLQAGMDNYIAKPIEAAELLATVERLGAADKTASLP